MPYTPPMPKTTRQKTSVYLDDRQVRRLTDLAEHLGRSQAEIIRDAIASYDPIGKGDRNFALARGFSRVDDDPRPISEIPEEDLLDGFGE
jgi:predicted DNA-binding protein